MKKYSLLGLLLFLCTQYNFAHTINYELDPIPESEIFISYLKQGFTHILPLGLDHILFVMCIFLLNSTFKQIVLQASVFTIAHSITLALSVFGYLNTPPAVVEPIIALSIAFLAIENILLQKIKPWRYALIFIFGLVHGMGFAGALDELGMPQYSFATALFSFNIGVEIGQLTILAAMGILFYYWKQNSVSYRRWVVLPLCLLISFISFYWTVERIFLQ